MHPETRDSPLFYGFESLPLRQMILKYLIILRIVRFNPRINLYSGKTLRRIGFSPFHGGNTGSSPVGRASKIKGFLHRAAASVPEVSRQQRPF
jgi:hypothetical protein